MGEAEFTAFSILCKLYLPKQTSERMNMAFSEYMTGAIQFQELSKRVTREIVPFPKIAQVWSMLLHRRDPPEFREYRIIYDVICHFQKEGALAEVLCFFTIVADRAHTGAGEVALLTDLMDLYRDRDIRVPAHVLCSAALELYHLIPKTESPPKEPEWLQKVTDADVWDPHVIEDLAPLGVAVPKKEGESGKKRKEESLGKSYVRAPVEISNGFPAFVTNSIAKSYSRGSEGTSTESTGQYFQRELRSVMLDKFEAMERADQQTYAMMNQRAQSGVVLRQALQDLYEADWKAVLCDLKKEAKGLEVIRERSLAAVPAAYHRRLVATLNSEVFLEALPQLDLGNLVVFPEEQIEVPMEYNERTPNNARVVAFLDGLASDSNIALLAWFHTEVLARCLPSVKENTVRIRGSRLFGNLMYLYSQVFHCIYKLICDLSTHREAPKTELLESVKPIKSAESVVLQGFFKSLDLQEPAPGSILASYLRETNHTESPSHPAHQPNPQAPHDPEDSFDVAIESAVFSMQTRIMPVNRTRYMEFIKSALADIKSDDMFEQIVTEAQELFGGRTKYFNKLMAVYGKMYKVLKDFHTSGEWSRLWPARNTFMGPENFDSYCAAVRELVKGPIVEIEMTGHIGTMKLRQINCSVKKD